MKKIDRFVLFKEKDKENIKEIVIYFTEDLSLEERQPYLELISVLLSTYFHYNLRNKNKLEGFINAMSIYTDLLDKIIK